MRLFDSAAARLAEDVALRPLRVLAGKPNTIAGTTDLPCMARKSPNLLRCLLVVAVIVFLDSFALAGADIDRPGGRDERNPRCAEKKPGQILQHQRRRHIALRAQPICLPTPKT